MRTSPAADAGADARFASHPGTAGEAVWRLRAGELSLDRPRIMGILNVTPDSFSDGGELASIEAALRRAERMVAEGAALLDVGGESTRPGAADVPDAEELRRTIPVVEALASRFDVPVSIDTRKAGIARAALDAGASVVNDVSGLTHDPELAGIVARAGAGLVLMHMRGTPADMRERSTYGDLVREVDEELGAAVARARLAGVPDAAIVLDPGLGFAKTAAQSLLLLRELRSLTERGFPLLVGPSRKSFVGEVLGGVPPTERVIGSAAACAIAYLAGARLFRVHDVREAADALAVAAAVEAGDPAAGRSVRGRPE